MILKLRKSCKLRNSLMREQHIAVQNWYRRAYRQLSHTRDLSTLEKGFENAAEAMKNNTVRTIKSEMAVLCQTTVTEVEETTGYKFPRDIVDRVISAVILGFIYSTKWTLDKAVNNIYKKNQKVIKQIIESGKHTDKSTEEIIDDVLAVINPDDNQYQHSYTTKTSTLYVGKPTATTERLMRTSLEHAYQEMIRELSAEIQQMSNAVVMIRWVSVLEPNTCEICESRHNNLYLPEELPLEHPNGQCEFYIEIT